MTRTFASLVQSSRLAVCGLLLAGSFASAADPPTTATLRAADGHPIAITYYPVAEAGKSGNLENAPVAVLLHGNDRGRIEWDNAKPARGETKNFVQTLQEDGYAVITVDLRKFGDSKAPGDIPKLRPDDYEKMSAGDLFAVKQFIYDKHEQKQFNMSKMAIIAAGPTAPVAVNFAAADWLLIPHDDAPVLANRTPRGQDVRALVLLSPDTSAGRLLINKGLNVIREPAFGVAMLVVSGTQDTLDKGQSKKVFELMEKAQRKGEERVYMLSPNLKDRELGLIGKAPGEVETPIRNFLNKHVKDLQIPWRDRKNKVTG